MVCIYGGKVVKVLGSLIQIELPFKENGKSVMQTWNLKDKGLQVTFNIRLPGFNSIELPEGELPNLKELVGKTVQLYWDDGVIPYHLDISVYAEA
jgi:hypothetical protein